MPELPEVETTRRGVEPQVCGRRVEEIIVRQPRLRWPVPQRLRRELRGQVIQAVARRGKYLLFATEVGTLIVHLGMSGSLRVVQSEAPPGKHDHLDLALEGGQSLRLTDPRRFGAALWTRGDPQQHRLLRQLGPEPLAEGFNGPYLHARAQGRKAAIKSFLMDSHVVVGVGNIYANEALFLAGIHPSRAAGRIAVDRQSDLAMAVKQVLAAAIAAGGTTLRDFVGGDGRPGYFAQQLRVYGRTGAACPTCGGPIRTARIGQRSTFYCPACQH